MFHSFTKLIEATHGEWPLVKKEGDGLGKTDSLNEKHLEVL